MRQRLWSEGRAPVAVSAVAGFRWHRGGKQLAGMVAVILLVVMAALFPAAGYAAVDAYQFDDPGQEARFKQLIAELRCLVCQNQNLADSNAELAQDMRRLTYEMVQRGESNEQIVAFMVQRYGDFVMYRPPFKKSTVMLWVGPFLILGVAILVLLMFIRRRSRARVEPLATAAHERARRLLDDQQT